jgi:hypothetical protein
LLKREGRKVSEKELEYLRKDVKEEEKQKEEVKERKKD